MESEVRSRKGKKVPLPAEGSANVEELTDNTDDEILKKSIEKLKELNEKTTRDSVPVGQDLDGTRLGQASPPEISDILHTTQGDGESAPDTPPPETTPETSAASSKSDSSSTTTKPDSTSSSTIASSKEMDGKPAPLELSLRVDAFSMTLFCLSLATRVWRLESPRGIVFDELHYGKYAGLYLKNTFFFDSQPPLGKQLIALAAYMAGYSGDFQFDRIGSPYDPSVPVAAMRLVPAFFGSLLMPTVYNIMIELGLCHYTGAIAAILMVFDNALLIQSRFILMEGMLLFFGMFGLLCILKFRRFYNQPYTFPWFACLILAATSLSAAFCVRYFGIFTFLLGVTILARDYWAMVGDRSVSDRQLLWHLAFRVAFFVGIPLTLYTTVFAIHLSVLYKAGPNDNIMTSAFQASLEGGLASIISNQPVKVLHGSQITLRHTHGRTCWLHSHDAVYPVKYPDERGSSHQQQVTCYSYKDVNNWWIVKKPERDDLAVSEPHEPIKNGDVVQIVHGLTSRVLNSHDVAAAMSPHNQEVACYIDYNVSMPAQDLWRVDILNPDATDGYWHAIESQLRLIHVNSSQALRFSGRQLPDWGFRQHEVVADKVIEQEDTIWNVEEHRYTRNDDQKEREKELMKQEMIPLDRRNLTLLEKFTELQYKMLFNNQENVAGHMYASDPIDWLSLKRGVAYWVSPSSNAQIHFIGNLVTWISGTLGLCAYLALFTFYILRRRRACYDLPEEAWIKFCRIGEVCVLGFVYHYAPYFLVDRTLFLHHYMPAYVFKICLLAAMLEHGHYLLAHILKLSHVAMLYNTLVGIWIVSIIYVFYCFAPVTYGNADLTADQVVSLSWRDTWDLIVHKQ